jgi:hypothetical protein
MVAVATGDLPGASRHALTRWPMMATNTFAGVGPRSAAAVTWLCGSSQGPADLAQGTPGMVRRRGAGRSRSGVTEHEQRSGRISLQPTFVADAQSEK